MMPSTSTSPSLRATYSRDGSPSPRQVSLSQIPTIQRLNTAIPQNSSITPASAQSGSSMTASPYFASVQSSPSIFQSPSQNPQLSNPLPLELPESIMPPPKEIKDVTPLSKSGSLMRKLSQTAKDGVTSTRQRLRRKASSSNQSRRDESTGPITRRRSDSKTLTTNGNFQDHSSLDSLVSDQHIGLGVFDAMSVTSEPTTLIDTSPEGEAPTVPDRLVRGCTMTKISKKLRQEKTFYLDLEGSRISWKGAVMPKSLHIDNIKSIRYGEEAASYQQELRGEEVDPERCLTINYATSDSSKSVKTLHLVAESKEVLDLWVSTLHILAKHREELMTSMIGSTERESVIRAHWDSEISRSASRQVKVDTEGLDLGAIQSLCRKLHIHCPSQVIGECFRLADPQNSGLLDYDQFKDFLRRLRDRQDVRKIFDSLRDQDKPGLTKAQFLSFLQDVQGLGSSKVLDHTYWTDKVTELINLSFPDDSASHALADIDLNAFTAFIVSKDCHIYSLPEETRPNFDRPLNEYFISSSHNTYLTGWQVGGTSSAEAYITALRHGCRCVEIDCWNGQDGNPRVTHGRTKTSAVLFSDCINAINRCAFDVSPYPLIISLEVHCDAEQQKKMVSIMKDVFAERLLLYPLSDTQAKLPSPEELKYKILVKVKATELHADLASARELPFIPRDPVTSSPYRLPAMPVTPLGMQTPTMPNPGVMSPPETIYSPTDRSMTATSASSGGEESDANMTSPNGNQAKKPAKLSKITPNLSELGVYLQGYTLRDPGDLVFQQYNHIFSLSENKAMDLCHTSDSKALFEDHNLNHLCRVYPRNLRVQSSNFDPNTFWRRGVQMVALNWQTFDAHLQMNQAMFASGTDQYGYVLKPDYLRTPRSKSGGFEHRTKLPRYAMSFSVKIISAQQLPRPQNIGKNEALNPFIEVQMFSAEDKARGIANGSGGQESSNPNSFHGIGSPYRRRTKVVMGNGYNPQFNETFELSLETKYPELVFVRFIVYNCPDGKPYGKNCKQLAVFTSKLASLQKGYRHLPLFNGHGEEFIFSTLFCQITQGEPKFMVSSLQDIVERTPRPSLFQGILYRGLSGDRGRHSGRERSTSIEEQRTARQLKLNREIEERFTKS